ncbi:MAG: hypothetical protein WA970_01650 [Gammaproteobacteria bacterium]|jgi:hypothetical protein|nr:hypothetical protein [Gammaproteobacteria bacterium]
MDRCPNCRARYREGAQCYRCGMELSQLLRIEAQAACWEGIAVGRLAAGDVTGADAAAAQALRRQRRPLALMLRMFVRDASPFWDERL